MDFEQRDLEDSGIIADLAIAGCTELKAPIIEYRNKFIGPDETFIFGQLDTALLDGIIRGAKL